MSIRKFLFDKELGRDMNIGKKHIKPHFIHMRNLWMQ